MSSYDLLFEPVQIGPVTAPNRFYAVPHATGHGWNQPSGAIALRGMKAQGGWGTVAVQITEISPNTDMANHPMERIWDDSDIPRHAAQVEAIKKHDSLAAIELGHGGMRARNLTSGSPVIGPTALPVLRPEVPVQAMEMTLADIRAFRDDHRAAARRAVEAGYDIIYVYAAHDISLLSNFLSINNNQRSDRYGGSFENRVRLLREVIEDTLEVAAGERAVALRFSVAEPGKQNGLRHDGEGRDVVEALAELPDLWDVNLSGWPHDSQTARFADEGYQLPYTDFVKSLTTKPVVGVGRFTSPDMMVSLVKKGRLDLIGAARPSIADPFLPEKIRNDRIDEIRECIGCNICVSMDSYGLPLRCTQNPTISEEWRRGWHPETVPQSDVERSHLIVGAGPAGLECAVTLLKAGHRVTIAEAGEQAGGRALKESRLPGLSSWLRVRDYRLYQISQAAKAELFVSSELTLADALEFGADTITFATGAKWRDDGVGSTSAHAIDTGTLPLLTPDDILNDLPELALFGSDKPASIVVYDDDHFYIASAIAERLAMNGHRVCYVTPLPTIATWTDFTLDMPRIIARLNELGVELWPNMKLTGEKIFTDQLKGDQKNLDMDTLVFVGARVPNCVDGAFSSPAEGQPGDAQIYRTGDCLVPGTIQAAVLSGHQVARDILSGRSTLRDQRRDQITFSLA